MPKKRIAIVHPQFREGGGSEAAPLWAIEALKRDYDITIITMGKLNLNRFNMAYGTNIARGEIRLIEIPIPLFCGSRFDAVRGYRLARYCKRVAKDYDLMMSTYNVMDFGVKGIQFIADFSFDDKLRRSFDESKAKFGGLLYKNSVLRSLYLYFAQIIAGITEEGRKQNITVTNSDWSGRIMKQAYGIETQTIYPPVSGDFPDIAWNARENGFVCIGRLTPEKRIDKLIEIASKVRQRGYDVHLHIVGNLSESEYVRKLNKLAEENSSWLFMEGGKFGEEKMDFLARHKYGIHGRDKEPFGIAVAEMVKAGCVTFVPADGGQTEIVGHEALFYKDVGDAVDKIARVLEDRRLSQELFEHLDKQGESFSVKRFKDEIKKLVGTFVEKKAINEINFQRSRMTKLAIVIATKDRPKDIRVLLNNLSRQSIKPDQIIIIDSSGKPVDAVVGEFPGLNIEYIRHPKPSASAQRNAGIKAVDDDIDLIGFLDDDVVLEDGALEVMMRFWADKEEDIGGCAFNLKNFKPTGNEFLKHSKLSKKLGLYSEEQGVVMPSGWATMIGEVKEDIFVQWLPSGASLWRKSIFDKFQFEEHFEQYSYLEDLDFSYGVGKYYKLMVIADAGYYHYHSPSGRISHYQFGITEILNRLYFVKKNGLSIPRCYLAIFVRLAMTLLSSVKDLDLKSFQRGLGNCLGLFQFVVRTAKIKKRTV
jgi:glycosyltransferase involved in cell wall biosynthesis/GT2 family glycosyltransferase